MKDKRKEVLIELLLNENFKKWVLEPTQERDLIWQAWIDDNPGKEDLVSAAKEIIKSASYRKLNVESGDKDEILSNILIQTLPQGKRSIFTSEYKSDRSSAFTYVYKAAAVILVLITVSGLIWWNKLNVKREGNVKEHFVKKENPNGRKSNILLPDGTKVILNSGSALTYSSDYGDENRTVRIQGEAFFDVERNIYKPFNVISGDIMTTALGTSFNVRAFENETTLKISLRTGKVKVVNLTQDDSARENMLNPGEGFVIQRSDWKIDKVDIDPLMEFGWKDDILAFRDNNLQEVVKALERWYGVDIKISGQPEKQWRVDAKYDNESLEQVLQGLSFTYDLEFRITGKNVELKFK